MATLKRELARKKNRGMVGALSKSSPIAHMVQQLASANNGHATGSRTGYLRIVVSKSNPSRGSGYEVAHFIVRGRTVKSLSERDVFLPSLAKAANWVRRNYPEATLERERNDCTGHLAALCFRCGIADAAPRQSKS